MSEYRIQSETLEAIGDAIRSKTGGSALIAPEDMADEIASIQTGGASPWELIADYTSDAIATTVVVDIPSEYQNENVYMVSFNGNFTREEYPYFGVNGSFSTYTTGCTKLNTSLYLCKRPTNNGAQVRGTSERTGYAFCVPNLSGSSSGVYPVRTVSVRSYYEDCISSGMNIKVWRLVE